MNIITFDIEEWYRSYQIHGRAVKYAEYNKYLDAILDKLDERQQKATFFCVGEMGRLFPEVVQTIQKRGHEVGCHSNIHTWLNKMTEAECREDTRKAVDSLEQCIGEKVKSYRAPAFSIDERNKWAFEILAENGIERDASVFPAIRDFGGFSNFGHNKPCIIEYNGIEMKEFPICTVKIAGKGTAYSGGGYFRFFPLPVIKKEIKRNNYSIFYFHIADLIPESHGVMSKDAYEAYFKEKGTVKVRYLRYIKTNLGKKNALSKMMRLIEETGFINIQQANGMIDWASAEVVKL